jgi:RNA polymerase sigma-70 factor (ECF subfamily)
VDSTDVTSHEHLLGGGALRAGSDALVRRAQSGDPAAYDALVRPRMHALLQLAQSILGNEHDAHDAVQESCLRAWQEIPRLRDPDRFEAWLWRIVINACRSALRGRRRATVREIAVDLMPPGEELADRAQPLDDELSGSDLVRRAFRRLDVDRRTILVLHYVDGRSVTDIAAVLNIPEGTAKWRLHAARASLERALEVERR